jgi:hypothetical protein
VLNEDVRSWEDLGFMAIFPAHEVGRCSVLAKYLEDLGVALRLPLMMPANDQAIARLGPQRGII